MKNYEYGLWALLFILAGILYFTMGNHQSQVRHYEKQLDRSEAKIDSLNGEITKVNNLYLSLLNNMNNLGNVDVTVYQPVEAQTNSRYWETADQSIIDLDNPKAHRWIAVSRNLHERWGGPLKFGSLVWVAGIGEHSGVYEVRDIMNKRYKNRIDILVGLEDEIYSFINNPRVELYEIPTETRMLFTETQSDYINSYQQNLSAQ